MIFRMLMSNIILVLVLNVLADLYFYRYFILEITRNRAVRWAHWILDFLFVATIAALYASMFWGGASQQAYQVFMIVYLIVYLPKLAYMIFSLPAVFIRKKEVRRMFYGLGAAMGFLLLFSFTYGVAIGPGKLRVTHTELSFPDLPEEFDGYTLVHFSDAHLGNMKNDRVLRAAIEETGEIDPDIVVFSGDLVHSHADEAIKFKNLLSEFRARDGVYAVRGNHDYGGYSRRRERSSVTLEQIYGEVGWHFLSDTSQVIRRGADSIAVIGIENWGLPPFPQYGDLNKALEGVDNTSFKILVSHDPTHWSEQVRDKTDIELTLSGHTHGMQLAVSLFGERYSPASLRYEMWGGLYGGDGQYLYVNEGMGIAMFPFRLGAFPELTVIKLKKGREEI